jgi:hypothetical protein
MMSLLGIKSLRPGRSGSAKAENHANYDESQANPFPSLPDPLVFKDGTAVTNAREWQRKRRPEIIELFDREVLGRVPRHMPKVEWIAGAETTETNGEVVAMRTKLVGSVDNSSWPSIAVNIHLTLEVPANARKRVPVVMQLAWDLATLRKGARRTKAFNPPPGPRWQEQALRRGWAAATLIPVSIQADSGDGLCAGIIGLCNKGQPRKPDDWGAIRAWAWGASRALDYFQTDKRLDASRVAIAGHSRYGKTALVAMAYDPRFAAAYISSSGEGGAKLHRRDFGEIVENLTATGEYHWMAGSFLKYGGPLEWNDLPVDAHELIALCAPRPVFVSAGSTNGDAWADPQGMFMAAAAASPVYELLGEKGLSSKEFPRIGTPLTEGDLAYCQHTGGHTDAPNWPLFLDFADRYFRRK